MAERRLKVVLEAQVDRYKSAMSAAASSTKELEKAAQTTGNTTAKRAKALKELSPILMAVGTATVAGLGLSVKAAMDWESAWTGVMKTVDGTPEQLAKVEEGLRGLARELPASHTEIAAVAEAAGQLGVATPDVVEFTRTMINLGESTNMSAEEAATTLARFANVMGTSTSEMNNLGAAIVGLGNNYATTESEIAAMGQRLSGAGTQIGLSEGQVLGLAAAMSSVGIEAEAGGTAMSLTMKRVGKAVDEGGATLETFAKVSGMSAEEFQQAWREDAGTALTTFVEGLGRAGEQGESVNAILTELGITGVREADAMLRLSAAGELMGEAMATGVDEFTKGSALIEEAQKRYETAESRIKIAWNTIKDAAIDAGSVILPAIATLADSVATLVGWFADLPAPVQTGVVALVSVAGVATLAVGAFAKFAPAIKGAIGAAKDLRSSFQRAEGPLTRAQTNISKVGRAAQTAAVGIAALGIIGPTIGSLVNDGTVANSEDMADALFRMGAGGEAASGGMRDLDAMFSETGNWFDGLDVGGLERAMEIVGNPTTADSIDKWVSTILTLGTRKSTNLEFVNNNLEELDSTLAQMASSGAAEQAAEAYEQVAAAAEAAGVPTEKLVELFPQYTDALGSAKVQSEAAAAGTEDLDAALEAVGVAVDGTVESLGTFLEQLYETGQLTRSAREAEFEFEGALRAVDEAVKTVTDSNGEMGAILNKNKDDFNTTTEAGELANSTFHKIADAGEALTKALAENGAEQDEVQSSLKNTYDSLIEAGVGMGLTKADAEALTREVLGIPDDADIDTWMSDAAKRTAEETSAAVRALDGMTATVVTNSVRNEITRRWTENPQSGGTSLERQVYGQGRQQSGGRVLQRRSSGGRLPATGLGIDQILGTDANGTPTAWVDDREWVINRRSSDKYNRELAMINAGTFPKLPGLAGGGQAAGAPQARDMVAAAPLAASSGPVTVEAPQIAAQVSSAVETAIDGVMSRWQPLVNLGGRDFYGVMQETNYQYGDRR
ncbi:phage tail tape measure protein [Zhihengliuella halotolerans]|uniref:phage tail tape measure protein n=1 Tax=Zhihengliuella halotolerans TaxID=370736 RepID=UPI000C809534|nr:phage tail tape measure protein [Zhihengliuella halotolerans]